MNIETLNRVSNLSFNSIYNFGQTWIKMFELGQHSTWQNYLANIVFPVVLVLFMVAIGLLIKQYLAVGSYQSKYDVAKQNADVAKSNKNRLSYNHWTDEMTKYRNQIEDSIFNDTTSILTVLSYTIWWLINRSIITLLSLSLLSGITRVLTAIILAIHSTITLVPSGLLLTIIIALIPIIAAIKRNKPQWLKLLLVISEMIMLLVIGIELIVIYG